METGTVWLVGGYDNQSEGTSLPPLWNWNIRGVYTTKEQAEKECEEDGTITSLPLNSWLGPQKT